VPNVVHPLSLGPIKKAEPTKGISFGSSAIFPSQRPAAFRPVLTAGLAFREVWFLGILLFIEDIPSSGFT
jgi:hypothetical protein